MLVDGVRNAVQVAVGYEHTCAVLAEGTVRCWGHGRMSQLGDGGTDNRARPVSVRGLRGVTQIAAGYRHTCALLQDGSARCWGQTAHGQLGDGRAYRSLVPVRTTFPP